MTAKRPRIKQRPAPGKGAPLRWHPWGLARAFVVGLFMCASLMRVVPLDPSVAFLLGGVAIGLAVPAIAEALAVSVVVHLSAVALVLLTFPGQQAPLPAGTIVLTFAATLVGAALGQLSLRAVPRRTAAWVLAALVVFVFLVQAFTFAPQLAEQVRVEPPDEQYAFDPVFFVKVFYLQERGTPFHQSFGEAFAADKRFETPTPDLAGWRSPVTSTMWSLAFGSGAQIVYAFVFLAALAMVAVYFLASGAADEISALAAPALLVPYYLFALQRFWFPEYEFWAAFFVLASAVLYALKRFWPAVGFAFLGGAMREWLIGGAIAGAVDRALKRRWREAIPWMVAAVLIVAVYVANMAFVRDYLVSVGVTPSLGASSRVGGGGPGFILYTVTFCADLLASPALMSYLAFFMGLAGSVRLVLRKEYFLPALVLLPLCAFLVFGSGRGPGDETGWNDYYNAAYWPFVVTLVPAALHLLPGRRSEGHE